jgi:predicted DNA-binding transcriptional regulator AlpA
MNMPVQQVFSYELIGRDDVCRMLGGIDPSTLYRGIAAKKYPAPIKDGSRSRWLKGEIETVVLGLIAARDSKASA